MSRSSIFSELTSDHVKKQSALKERTEVARREALRHVGPVVDLLVDSVNAQVQAVFGNEKQMEVEVRALALTVHKCTRQNAQWSTLFHSFDDALKEMGDFENWIKVIEYDMEVVSRALERITSPTAQTL